mgnify:CR=1 FL=1
MEVWNLLLQGFGVALQPINLGWALVGVTLGTIEMSINGGTRISIDLAGSDTAQDIDDKITSAIKAACVSVCNMRRTLRVIYYVCQSS